MKNKPLSLCMFSGTSFGVLIHCGCCSVLLRDKGKMRIIGKDNLTEEELEAMEKSMTAEDARQEIERRVRFVKKRYKGENLRVKVREGESEWMIVSEAQRKYDERVQRERKKERETRDQARRMWDSSSSRPDRSSVWRECDRVCREARPGSSATGVGHKEFDTVADELANSGGNF